jgi:hypothetical protein
VGGGTMIDGYSRSRGDGVAGDLAFLLFIYLAVAGGFAFGLYELLQPTRFTNPGLAAYKPPRATSVTLTNPQSADLAQPPVIFTTAAAAELDTDGRSMRQAPIAETPVRAHPPPKNIKPAKAFNRQTTTEAIGNQQRLACLPRYDSSGAQTHAC